MFIYFFLNFYLKDEVLICFLSICFLSIFQANQAKLAQPFKYPENEVTWAI